VIDHGPELILRKEPVQFDKEAIPFGDQSRPSASIMSVPVRHASEVIGLLSIQSYDPGAYDRRALDDFQALADYCGEALNRIRAEQSLLESEERYRDLVENSHEFICTHDLNGTVLSANRAVVQMLGCAPEDLIGKRNIREILAPEVRDQFADYMTRILKEGATSGIMLVQTRSGEQRAWEYYNSLRTDGVAAPIVRGIARDITEHRRVQKALQESEERYRELFENSKDALYVHTLSGEYTSVNRAAEKLSGYSRDEITGKSFGDFVVPEDSSQVRENWHKKLEHAGETSYEVEIITKQGRRIPVEVNSRLIYENGLPVAVQGSVRDITERKQAQEASRTYARGVIDAQEAERRRISMELHDQIGQILTAVKINLHALQRTGNGAAVLTGIEENLKVIDEAFVQVRNLSADLRPLLLDDFGLVVALRWYLERQTKKTGVPTQFVSMSLDDEDRFASDLETACFRIAQEAMTNVIRHAQATKISMSLESNGPELVLLVKDDGIGFDVKTVRRGAPGANMIGLRGMEERAQAIGGTVTVSSMPGKGTRVRASFQQGRD
jgi:PAS domain S-box-containing protein